MTDELVERCDSYLEGLHSTLWGSSFWITNVKGRREAAEWLAAQIRAVEGPEA